MKAIVQSGYGSPNVLALRDIEVPRVADDGVLVEVHAASVNALDWHTTRGKPFVIRLAMGLRTPRDRVRGVDLAGRVVDVGKNVTRFKVGDDVFGGSDGSFAEYVATSSDRIAHKPAAVTYEQAATLNVAGLTSLQGLRDKAQLKAGQRLLIIGAGGGVGTFAVQIAKWLGAHVTAMTRAQSIDSARSLGADDVIDHDVEDFAQRRQRYDVVVDIGGGYPFAQIRRVTTDKGSIVVVGGPAGWLEPAGRMLKAAMLSPVVSQRIVPFISKTDHEGLALLAGLVSTGRIRPVLNGQYSLSDAPEAIRYIGTRHARGKIIIRIR